MLAWRYGLKFMGKVREVAGGFSWTRIRVCMLTRSRLPGSRHLSNRGVSLAHSLGEGRQALWEGTGVVRRLHGWDQVALCSTLQCPLTIPGQREGMEGRGERGR